MNVIYVWLHEWIAKCMRLLQEHDHFSIKKKNTWYWCFKWMHFRPTDSQPDRRTQPIIDMRGHIHKERKTTDNENCCTKKNQTNNQAKYENKRLGKIRNYGKIFFIFHFCSIAIRYARRLVTKLNVLTFYVLKRIQNSEPVIPKNSGCSSKLESLIGRMRKRD